MMTWRDSACGGCRRSTAGDCGAHGSQRFVVVERKRGTWRWDEERQELVEEARADAVAESDARREIAVKTKSVVSIY